MARTLIYIDVETGTWGHADNIMIYSASDYDLNGLAESSDSQICTFGQDNGKPLTLGDIHGR